MKFNRISRRHWLQGVGASLALPILPSLLPRTARAATAPGPKAFIGLGMANGRIPTHGPNSVLMPPTPFKPPMPTLQETTVGSPFPIHSGSLSALAAANGGKISQLIDASYTPYLKKMFMLQGLDYVATGTARHHWSHFGAQQVVQGPANTTPPMPTIDLVLSRHRRAKRQIADLVVYSASDKDAPVDMGFSWDVSPTPGVIHVPTPGHLSSPATLWAKYFGSATVPVDARLLLVDRVLADYKSVRTSPRLGSEDRRRLDAHIEHLAAAEARVKQVSCEQLQPSKSLTDRKVILQTMNDVIVGLISCGYASVFTGWSLAHLDEDPGRWHTWSHNAYITDIYGTVTGFNAPDYNLLMEQNRVSLRDLGLDLAKKLDAVGLLDDSLIVAIQEHSIRGHEAWNVPIIGFGSAGGAFVTDKYIDYRNVSDADRDDAAGRTCFGFPMNQLWANILQAMGMAPSDFEPMNKSRSDWTNVFRPGSGYGCASMNHLKTGPNPNDYEIPPVFVDHYKRYFTGHDLSAKMPLLRT